MVDDACVKRKVDVRVALQAWDSGCPWAFGRTLGGEFAWQVLLLCCTFIIFLPPSVTVYVSLVSICYFLPCLKFYTQYSCIILRYFALSSVFLEVFLGGTSYCFPDILQFTFFLKLLF